jgi:hypothetical protein
MVAPFSGQRAGLSEFPLARQTDRRVELQTCHGPIPLEPASLRATGPVLNETILLLNEPTADRHRPRGHFDLEGDPGMWSPDTVVAFNT